MRFNQSAAQVFIPDGQPEAAALARTTHLAIGAHQDDVEFIAAEPIMQCFQQPDKAFSAVIVTDGRGSARAGLYEKYSDDDMRAVRIKEQKKAAVVGEYAALALLDYPSKAVKDGADQRPVEDLARLLVAMRPDAVYTHNPADKHDTHVGVLLKTVAAVRSLPADQRPKRLYGCECWRDLDWLCDADKTIFDVSAHENLHAALMGVFDSQITGGKRYDLATAGRRRANATFLASHGVDTATDFIFALDLTPLILGPNVKMDAFIQPFIQRFAKEVSERMKKLGGKIMDWQTFLDKFLRGKVPILRSRSARRDAVLDRGAGMWKHRTDLPDFDAMREEWSLRERR